MAADTTATNSGRIVALVAGAAFLASCSVDSQPYYQIVSGMEPVEHGDFERESLYFAKKIPIRYRLESDAYVLVADVHRDSLHPSLLFSVIGGAVPDPVLSGESPSACFGRFLSPMWLFPDLRDARNIVHLYTADLSARECRDDANVNNGEAKIALTVASDSGEVVAVHELTIRLEQTGWRILWDGP